MMQFDFLMCSERSGSNLITKILDAHSRVCGPFPTHLLRIMALNLYRYGDLSVDSHWEIFLEDVQDLLEHRIAEKDWTGTIVLFGETHRAALAISGRRVTALERVPARADIMLEGSDAAITQIVTGVHSPLEPYLQLDLRIRPALNAHVQDLLETLFPKVQVY